MAYISVISVKMTHLFIYLFIYLLISLSLFTVQPRYNKVKGTGKRAV